jgi:hypothetical protein
MSQIQENARMALPNEKDATAENHSSSDGEDGNHKVRGPGDQDTHQISSQTTSPSLGPLLAGDLLQLKRHALILRRPSTVPEGMMLMCGQQSDPENLTRDEKGEIEKVHRASMLHLVMYFALSRCNLMVVAFTGKCLALMVVEKRRG